MRPLMRLSLFKASKPNKSENFTLELAGKAIPVKVRRHAASRNFTLRVTDLGETVTLTLPKRSRLKDARAFVERHSHWLENKLAKVPQKIPFQNGAIIPYQGVPHQISHRPHQRGTVWVEEADMPLICVAGQAEHLPRRLTYWLKKQAKHTLTTACKHYTQKLGMPYRSLTLRDPTSRWGSCTSVGGLSFSWRLILAPPHVLEYLAAHEVAHLKELNHSPQYWAIVQQLKPDFETAQDWLKLHGSSLHRYG
jgi:predicted metal-dependent hydrolase